MRRGSPTALAVLTKSALSTSISELRSVRSRIGVIASPAVSAGRVRE